MTLLAAWIFNFRVTALAAGLLLLLRGAGLLLLTPFRLREISPAEETLLAVGLGAGAASILLLGMGLAGWYRTPGPELLLAVLAVLAVVSRARHAAAHPLSALVREARALPRGAAAVLLAALLATWLAALSPPVFYDALVYHLALPNLWLLRGGMERLPGVVYSVFPQAGETLDLLAIRLGDLMSGSPAGAGGRLQVASLLTFAWGALAALATAAFAARHWGRAAGLLAGGMILLSPPLFLLARYATVEPLLTLFTLLAWLCLWRRLDGGERAWTTLTGIFAGLAFTVKYVAGPCAVLLPFLALAWQARRRGEGRRADLFRFTVGVLLPALPWLLRNLAWTGNPVFPAFWGLLGGSGWSAEQAALLARDAKAAGTMLASWTDLARLPFDLAVGTRDFGAAGVSLWVWPLALCGALGLLVKRRRAWKEGLLLAFLGGSLILWASTYLMARFLLPAMALGLAAFTAWWTSLSSERARVRPGLLLALLATATALYGALDGPTCRAYLPSLGLQSRPAYLASMLRAWPATEFVNRELPPDARVLVLGDAKVAYLGRDHLWSTALDRPLLPALLEGRTDPEGMAATLARHGITHVLVNLRELKRVEEEYPLSALPPELRDAFFRFLDARGRTLIAGNGVHLVALSP